MNARIVRIQPITTRIQFTLCCRNKSDYLISSYASLLNNQVDIVQNEKLPKDLQQYKVKILMSDNQNSQFNRLLGISDSLLKKEYQSQQQQLLEAQNLYQSCGEEDHLPFVQEALSIIESKLQSLSEPDVLSENYSKSLGEKITSENYYFFYQSTDGQPYFMLPLNFSIMINDYQDFLQLPYSITADVLEIETFQQNFQTQKRYKYLSHVPLGAILHFVEIDLSTLINQVTFSKYEKQILERRENRKLKQKGESSQGSKQLEQQLEEINQTQEFNPENENQGDQSFEGFEEPKQLKEEYKEQPKSAQSPQKSQYNIQKANIDHEIRQLLEENEEYEQYLAQQPKCVNLGSLLIQAKQPRKTKGKKKNKH